MASFLVGFLLPSLLLAGWILYLLTFGNLQPKMVVDLDKRGAQTPKLHLNIVYLLGSSYSIKLQGAKDVSSHPPFCFSYDLPI